MKFDVPASLSALAEVALLEEGDESSKMVLLVELLALKYSDGVFAAPQLLSSFVVLLLCAGLFSSFRDPSVDVLLLLPMASVSKTIEVEPTAVEAEV